MDDQRPRFSSARGERGDIFLKVWEPLSNLWPSNSSTWVERRRHQGCVWTETRASRIVDARESRQISLGTKPSRSRQRLLRRQRRRAVRALVDFDVVIDPASRPSAASSAPEISFDPSYDLENSSDRFNSSGLPSLGPPLDDFGAKSARLFLLASRADVPRAAARARAHRRRRRIRLVSVSIARNGSSSLGNGTNAWSFRVPARASTASSSFIHRAWFSSLSSADSI